MISIGKLSLKNNIVRDRQLEAVQCRSHVTRMATKRAALRNCVYREFTQQTTAGIGLFDVTNQIRNFIKEEGVENGYVHLIAKHTTTALTINENEPRLLDDIRAFLIKLAPPGDFYLHNDLHLREAPRGWPGGWEAWAAQEPINAHSHILSIILGHSKTIPICDGDLMLGQWQSVLMVDLDGPRLRTVGIQLIG